MRSFITMLAVAITLAVPAAAHAMTVDPKVIQDWLNAGKIVVLHDDDSDHEPGIGGSDGPPDPDAGQDTPNVPGRPGDIYFGKGGGEGVKCIPLCGGEGGQTVWVPRMDYTWAMLMSEYESALWAEYTAAPPVNPDTEALAEWVAAGRAEAEFDPCAYAAWKASSS